MKHAVQIFWYEMLEWTDNSLYSNTHWAQIKAYSNTKMHGLTQKCMAQHKIAHFNTKMPNPTRINCHCFYKKNPPTPYHFFSHFIFTFCLKEIYFFLNYYVCICIHDMTAYGSIIQTIHGNFCLNKKFGKKTHTHDWQLTHCHDCG